MGLASWISSSSTLEALLPTPGLFREQGPTAQEPRRGRNLRPLRSNGPETRHTRRAAATWFRIPGLATGALAAGMLKRKLARCGARTQFDPSTSTFAGIACISFGEDVFVGPRAFISADGVAVPIGDDTVIGPDFFLLAGDHRFDSPGVLYREHHGSGLNAPVSIGCNVWIGARVLVLKGVRIGDGSVIGAGAIVTGDIPELSVATGAPARVVRERFTGHARDVHLKKMEGLWGQCSHHRLTQSESTRGPRSVTSRQRDLDVVASS